MTLSSNLRVNSRLILSAVCLLLVFGVGSVSAQGDPCAAFNRCDGDGDGFPKSHKGKCKACTEERIDCDDSYYDLSNMCLDPPSSAVFSAELTAGAFVFSDGAGGSAVVDDLRLDQHSLRSQATGIVMVRPADSTLAETWDSVFERGCPEMFNSVGSAPAEISATWDKWSISKYGERRLALSDIQLTYPGDVRWEITLQLIGPEGGGQPWLPVVGTSSISLTRFAIWGNERRSGSGRKSTCQPKGERWGMLPLAPQGSTNVTSLLEITRLE